MSRWALVIALTLGGCAIPTASMSVKGTSVNALTQLYGHRINPYTGRSLLSSTWSLPYWAGIQIPALGGLHPSLGALATPWLGGVSPFLRTPPSWWNIDPVMNSWMWGMMPPMQQPWPGGGRWQGQMPPRPSPWPGGGRWGGRPLPTPAPSPSPEASPSPGY